MVNFIRKIFEIFAEKRENKEEIIKEINENYQYYDQFLGISKEDIEVEDINLEKEDVEKEDEVYDFNDEICPIGPTIDDEQLVEQIKKYEAKKEWEGWAKEKRSKKWLPLIKPVAIGISLVSLIAGSYFLKKEFNKEKAKQEVQETIQCKDCYTQNIDSVKGYDNLHNIEKIKSNEKRIWIDNGTLKPDGNELELKVFDDSRNVCGMKNVNFENLYLLLTFDNGKKEVFKFLDGKTRGYIDSNTIDQRIKTAEVVELADNSLLVHATYERKQEYKLEGGTKQIKEETKEKQNQEEKQKRKQDNKKYHKYKKAELPFGNLDIYKLRSAYEGDMLSKNYNAIIEAYMNNGVENAKRVASGIFGYNISTTKFYSILDKHFGGIRKMRVGRETRASC